MNTFYVVSSFYQFNNYFEGITASMSWFHKIVTNWLLHPKILSYRLSNYVKVLVQFGDFIHAATMILEYNITHMAVYFNHTDILGIA